MSKTEESPVPEEERERLAEQSWNHHRDRQLKELGINPEDLDTGDGNDG